MPHVEGGKPALGGEVSVILGDEISASTDAGGIVNRLRPDIVCREGDPTPQPPGDTQLHTVENRVCLGAVESEADGVPDQATVFGGEGRSGSGAVRQAKYVEARSFSSHVGRLDDKLLPDFALHREAPGLRVRHYIVPGNGEIIGDLFSGLAEIAKAVLDCQGPVETGGEG